MEEPADRAPGRRESWWSPRRMAVDDADELLDAQLPQGAWDTVGGLVLDLAGRRAQRGRGGRGRRLPARGRAGPGPADRAGADRAAPCRRRDDVSRARRVRRRGRPAQRRQVDARQRHGRHQGVDHLARVPTPPATRCAASSPTRRPGRLRRHAGAAPPRTALGGRLNETARGGARATSTSSSPWSTRPLAIGPGDRRASSSVRPAPRDAPRGGEQDRRRAPQRRAQLPTCWGRRGVATSTVAEAAARVEYFPVSATTGEGVDALVDAVVAARCPRGRPLPRRRGHRRPRGRAGRRARARAAPRQGARGAAPLDRTAGSPSGSGRVIRCEILVERDIQKAIVIGKGGEVLKEVGTAVAKGQLPEGAYLELFVRVEPRWQQRDDALDRLGY